MENKEPTSRSTFQEELKRTSILKTIRKDNFLKAPDGYYDQLDVKLLERIHNNKDTTSVFQDFTFTPLVRWGGLGAALCLLTLVWFVARQEVRDETALLSKSNQVGLVHLPDSVLMESIELHTMDEHVLASELHSLTQAGQTDSLSLQAELTEYLILHVDQDLLIESL